MTVSVRDIVHNRISPIFRAKAAPAGAPPLAGPMDLMGADPDKSVTYFSEAARALSGPEAAQLDVPYTLSDRPPGSGFNATA